MAIKRANGEILQPHVKMKVTVHPGDEIIMDMAGGGGFYPPEERDPEMVLNDVINGLVTLERAERDYKVAIDLESRKVDWDKTNKLRGIGGQQGSQ